MGDCPNCYLFAHCGDGSVEKPDIRPSTQKRGRYSLLTSRFAFLGPSMFDVVEEILFRFLHRSLPELASALLGFFLGIMAGIWVLAKFGNVWAGTKELQQSLENQGQEIEDIRIREKRLNEERFKEISNLKKQHRLVEQDLTDACVELREDALQLQKQLKQQRQSLSRQKSQTRVLTTELEELRLKHKETLQDGRKLRTQLRSIFEHDGKVWNRPFDKQVPHFRSHYERRARVVSVLNLKGGVGKTTISANLSAAFASYQLKTLAIDLDHQHSLTDLLITESEREQFNLNGHLIERFLQNADQNEMPLYNLIFPVDEMLSLIGCQEELADIETRLMAQWMVGQTQHDVRFLMRDAIHSTSISDDYDWIVMDCPPRLTTATINALAASDYVIIPTILDPTSSNSVPRLLRWLGKFKDEISLCPDLSVLGIIANKTQQIRTLSKNEKERFSRLKEHSKDIWKDPVEVFETFIPHRVSIGQADAGKVAFESDEQIRSVFLDLAGEILKRVPHHASSTVDQFSVVSERAYST